MRISIVILYPYVAPSRKLATRVSKIVTLIHVSFNVLVTALSETR